MEAIVPPKNQPALRGEVVYFHAFDFAYDMHRTPIDSLLQCPLQPFQIDARKRGPRGQVFFRPLMAHLPDLQQRVRGIAVTFHIEIKLLPIGALSVTARTAFGVNSLSELADWQEPVFDDGSTLSQWVNATIEKARAELAIHSIRPRDRLPEGESYRVFCIDSDSPALGKCTQDWLVANRESIATLLTGEISTMALSAQEIEESTSRWLSYYRHDLTVADWDAALVVDRPSDFAETLYIMELANVQLEELEAYDTFLDEALERAYRDLGKRRPERKGGILTELKELRIDLARFSDELSNITKFFGEWHVARVYETMSRLFHLGDWHRAIDEKLRTLDSLYEMLKQDRNHRIMLWLEVSIVLLFILDLIMLIPGMAK